MSRSQVSDRDLKLLFYGVDLDRGGTISASEFQAFLFPDPNVPLPEAQPLRTRTQRASPPRVRKSMPAAEAAEAAEADWGGFLEVMGGKGAGGKGAGGEAEDNVYVLVFEVSYGTDRAGDVVAKRANPPLRPVCWLS